MSLLKITQVTTGGEAPAYILIAHSSYSRAEEPVSGLVQIRVRARAAGKYYTSGLLSHVVSTTV